MGPLGGQEMAISHPGSSRSHSNSPNPAASQVSHMRTRTGHADPANAMHNAMHGFLSGAYGDLPTGAMPYQQQQQLLLPQQHPFAVTDDVFMFSDLDHAFMTSSVPTYEEIMQACMPQPPYAAPAPMFPPPTLGFHPSASSGFAAPGQQQFEQSAFYGRAPTPMDTDGAFDAAQAGAFWESLQWAPGP